MQGNTIQEEVTSILARMEGSAGQDGHEPTPPAPPERTEPVEDIYVFIVREHDEAPDQPADDDAVIETTLAPQKPSLLALLPFVFALLLTGSSIALQLFLAFHPFIATITILPKSQHVTLSGTVQLGRLLQQITLSQSQTAPTTGTGHQDAKQARGYITLYNGEFTSVTVPAGTVLTGADGAHIITDQDAPIPAGNPPNYGQVTVSAHALQAGSSGNIHAYDINVACCFASVFAKNPDRFTGGQNARDYQTVAQADIGNAEAPVKLSLAKRLTTALRQQLHSGEVLISPRCTTHVTPDHQPGEEATQVTITASETCTAATYNQNTLQATVTALLTPKATKQLGSGYRLIGNPRITVTSAAAAKQVRLSFTSISTWTYALNAREQHSIKKIIAGKNTQDALKLLFSMPGIATAAIQWSGFGDDTRLPKDPDNIHLALVLRT
jgi:Baseplate J-like protein